MPRVTRRRTIAAPAEEVWELISDPYSLPRWWPRTSRVESVDRKPDGKRSQWTKVLETAEGRGVRADYRCLSSAEGERYVWEQQLAGSPFERHLRSSVVEIGLRSDEDGTVVSLTSDQKLRGMSRLGSPMMRGGQGKILDQALDGLETALGGSP
ncbi:MAG TPA: SRPBCC family protein [Solirubrobacterales bacterium]|nr:SRPBCC family protein [Solirubrobacterales bacterium]